MALKPSQQKPWLKYYDKNNYGLDPALADTEQNLLDFIKIKSGGDPDRVAFKYFTTNIKYADFFRNVKQTAEALTLQNVKPNDIVTIVSIMTPEVIYLFYALNQIGAIPHIVDPRSSAENLKDYFEETGSNLIVTLDKAYPKVRQALRGQKQKKLLVISPKDSLEFPANLAYKFKNPHATVYPKRVLLWKTFFKKGQDLHRAKAAPYDPNRPALIVRTGGTTGTPKGVMLPAKALNALAYNFGASRDLYRQKVLDIMPPFIAYGFSFGVHLGLVYNCTTTIIPATQVDELGKLIKKHKPYVIAGTPLYYQNMITDPAVQNLDLSFLHIPGIGGDAITVPAETEVNLFLKRHHAPCPATVGYGMTEVCSCAVVDLEKHSKLGSAGIPLPQNTVGIFDPKTGEEKSYNEEGEVCIQAPTTMLGYYNKPEETAKVLKKHKDGQIWVHTGDVGVMDADGFLFIRSRIKRVIIRFDGFKVYCTQIEDAVSKHKDVFACSAVSMRDPHHRHGNLPVVFIQWKDGTKNPEKSRKEVIRLCKRLLPSYMLPAKTYTIDKMPYTNIAKIDYRKLEEML